MLELSCTQFCLRVEDATLVGYGLQPGDYVICETEWTDDLTGKLVACVIGEDVVLQRFRVGVDPLAVVVDRIMRRPI